MQTCILLAALLTTAPSPLGLRGIGCVTTYSTNPAENWFWQAYKGIVSSSRSSERIIFLPAINSNVCIVIDRKDISSLDDRWQVTLGYAEAARLWIWLIDPDEWESARTKEIRFKLRLLLGEDFSSYAELQEWWNQNNGHLVWSGEDELLGVREPTVENLAHGYYTRTPLSAVEQIRRNPDPWTPGLLDSDSRAALVDREARLRGLKLAAGDFIAVLSGERERNARELLEHVTGHHFATKVEWQNFFSGNPPAPWNMSRASAQQWVALIRLLGQTEPYRSRYVEKLHEATGLNYSTPEEFIPWLQNPENARQEEWFKARDLLGDLQGADPDSVNKAVRSLKQITDRFFDSPQLWIAWWQTNQAKVVLSPDGRMLVVGP